MPDGTLPLSLTDAKPRAGYRLRRLEFFNWGTFNNRVRTLVLNGDNALLTGGNGAGKSTVVDAITTLLVPPAKVQYNKAAGAEEAERNARSYVLGYYKSARDENTGSKKPGALRDLNSYSALLAVFHNPDGNQTTSIAQVLWMKEGKATPERIFICSERDLTISRDFANFGQDFGKLRKRLRAEGALCEDAYPRYAAAFCRRMGLDGTQPLELFNQAVSMKSVGSLTSFVRERMLPPTPVKERIDELIMHFDDLDRAHKAVVKAQKQIEALRPVVADCDLHLKLQEEVRELRLERDGLDAYLARCKLGLLDTRLEDIEKEWERADSQARRFAGQLSEVTAQIERLGLEIAQNGGDSISRLEADIAKAQNLQETRQDRARRYASAVQGIGGVVAEDETAFLAQRERIGGLRREFEVRKTEATDSLVEVNVRIKDIQKRLQDIDKELLNLRSRRSNIDADKVRLRAWMCTELGCDEHEMPYAGELIQVRADAREWEGAAERLLRGVGLTLLVTEAWYPRVVRWVNAHHLGTLLDYQRVPAGPVVQVSDVHRDALVHKLSVKPDTPFRDWLYRYLCHRADHVCCADIERFERETRAAVTRAGNLKEPGGRHRKDDRYDINDRSRYVLGWNNAEKIAAFEAKQANVMLEAEQAQAVLTKVLTVSKQLETEQQNFNRLEEFTNFDDLDWGAVARTILKLKEDLRIVREGSDVLQKLTLDLEAARTQARELQGKQVDAESRRLHATKRRTETTDLRQLTLDALPREDGETLQARLELEQRVEVRWRGWLPDKLAAYDKLVERAQEEGRNPGGRRPIDPDALSVENCDITGRDVRGWYQPAIDNLDGRISNVSNRLVKNMTTFCAAYPLDTADIDASVEAADEYRAFLARLERDDLPRFVLRFKDALNVNTIREIAGFSAELHRQKDEIRRRIQQINESLRPIEYNPGRYVKLVPGSTHDREIEDFQADLKACTEGGLTGSDDAQYSEAKFEQVKKIIDRLRGREGMTDIDRAWVAKVTEVRNWFVFEVSERYLADDTEFDFFEDSSGKSGGQKEKLAYTILAAGLAYQFGLKVGAPGARSFSFVTIDEAFGRASEESARFGLTLFQQLGLQLLVVTPLEKIHVIEPFVANVCFMQNENGNDSRLLNLSIDEFRTQREALGA